MALVKYGSIVTELKGKVGGQVYQKARNGYMLRNKGTNRSNPIIINNPSQLVNFSLASKIWAKLTAAQRESWEAIAPGWLFTDKFGNQYQGSAFQVFVSAITNRLYDGYCQENCENQECIDVYGPCLSITAPSLNAATLPNWDVAKGPGATQMVFSLGDDLPESQFIALKATRPLPASSSAKRAKYSTIYKSYLMVEQNILLNTVYTNIFGALPPAGSVVYVNAFTWRHGWEREQYSTTWKITW